MQKFLTAFVLVTLLAFAHACDEDKALNVYNEYGSYIKNTFYPCFNQAGDDTAKGCACGHGVIDKYRWAVKELKAAKCLDKYRADVDAERQAIEQAEKDAGANCNFNWDSAFGAKTGILAATIAGAALVANRGI